MAHRAAYTDGMPDFWTLVVDLVTPGVPPVIAHGFIIAVTVAALILTVPAPLWRVTGVFATYVHELGHVYSAVLTGRRVRSFRIRADHSGVAVSSGGTVSAVISGLCGYPAPAIVGALTLFALSRGWGGVALVAGTLLVALSLLVVRGWLSVLVLTMSVAVGVLLMVVATAQVRDTVLLALGIALLIAGVRDLVKLLSLHTVRRDRAGHSDATLLRRATGVPVFFWLVGMTAMTLAALWLGAASIASLWALAG